MIIGAVEDHRGREGGALVYPVYSRRSKGLSMGINLFPDRKACTFDCPYCEVFPFNTAVRFSTEAMAETLRERLMEALAVPEAVRDICFSGNGEPAVSRHFPPALEAAAQIRAELAPRAALVVITNGTGLLDGATFERLRRAAVGPEALDVWLKLDAGTEGWYARMARSAVPFARLTAAIKAFARIAPFTIQTMLCAVGGVSPSRAEAAAWERLVLELAAFGGVAGVQIYGKARPGPGDPLASPLPPRALGERAAALRAALRGAGLRGPGGKPVPVGVFL